MEAAKWFSPLDLGKGLFSRFMFKIYNQYMLSWYLGFQLSIVLYALLFLMIPHYNTILPTRLHGLNGLTICLKVTPVSVFDHQFRCHFHHIFPKGKISHLVKQFQITNYVSPLVRNVVNGVKFISNHTL